MFIQKFAICTVVFCSSLANASGLDSLEQFVKSAKTGRAEFTQVVTAPAKEGQAAAGEGK